MATPASITPWGATRTLFREDKRGVCPLIAIPAIPTPNARALTRRSIPLKTTPTQYPPADRLWAKITPLEATM